MQEQIEAIDQQLLLFINGLHADWLDPIMWAISSKWFWLPFVALLLLLLIKKFGKKSWLPIIITVLCFATTDQVSHHVKENVCRYRPTHNLEIAEKVHLVNDYRGGQYGFFSGHAANSFGLAMITLLFVRKKWYCIFAILWAAVVAYSRMYLGVHYPSDIFVGTCFGLVSATLIFFVFTAFNKKRNYIIV